MIICREYEYYGFQVIFSEIKVFTYLQKALLSTDITNTYDSHVRIPAFSENFTGRNFSMTEMLVRACCVM